MTAPPDLLSVPWDLPLPPTAGDKAIITSTGETIPSSRCYRTQSGSAHLPLSPGSEGQPAIRPWFSPDKRTLLRASSRRLSFEFFGFRPPHGFVSRNLIYYRLPFPRA